MTDINQHYARLLTSLNYVVFREKGGEIIGALNHAEDAAALVSLLGDGAVVLMGDRSGVNPSAILWTEGVDGAAGDSYDEAARVMVERVENLTRR